MVRGILIAGITGFLGSRLARELVHHESTAIIGLHRTKSNLDRLQGVLDRIELHNMERHSLETLFKSRRVDTVVNCLADYGRSSSSAAGAEANLHLPERLLELAVENGASMFLNAGTSLPTDVNHYALTKNRFSDRLSRHSSKLIAIDARLEHFYGPGESEERFISFLISQFLKPVPVLDLTRGEQRRDFLHVDDVASAFCLLMDKGRTWPPGSYEISVGSGEAYLLRDVVEKVRRLADNHTTQVNYGAVAYRENEVMHSRADIRALEELGWRPRWNLEEGLRHAVESYRLYQGRKAA